MQHRSHPCRQQPGVPHISAVGNEAFYLLRLQRTVVVGADDVEPDVIVGISCDGELPVELGAPGVVAALRDTDVPRGGRLRASAQRPHCCKQGERTEEGEIMAKGGFQSEE